MTVLLHRFGQKRDPRYSFLPSPSDGNLRYSHDGYIRGWPPEGQNSRIANNATPGIRFCRIRAMETFVIRGNMTDPMGIRHVSVM